MIKLDIKSKNKSQKIVVISFLVLFSFIFLSLITGLIAPLSRFLYGVFGLSVYGLVLAGILFCVLNLMGKKINVKYGYVINFVAMYLLVILLVHMITSMAFLGEGTTFSSYISDCYNYSQNQYSSATFGGVLSGVFVYSIYKTLTAWGAYAFFILALLVTIFVTTNFFLKFYSNASSAVFFADKKVEDKESNQVQIKKLKLKTEEVNSEKSQDDGNLSPITTSFNTPFANNIDSTKNYFNAKEIEQQSEQQSNKQPSAFDLLYGKEISSDTIKAPSEIVQPEKPIFETSPTVNFGAKTASGSRANQEQNQEEKPKEMLTYSQSSPHIIRANPVPERNTSPIINAEYLAKQKEMEKLSSKDSNVVVPPTSVTPIVSQTPVAPILTNDNYLKETNNDVFMEVDTSAFINDLNIKSTGSQSKQSHFDGNTVGSGSKVDKDYLFTEQKPTKIDNIIQDKKSEVTIKEIKPLPVPANDIEQVDTDCIPLEVNQEPAVASDDAGEDFADKNKNLPAETSKPKILQQPILKAEDTGKGEIAYTEEEDELIIYPPYNAPSLDLLDSSPMVISVTREECEINKERIEATLEEFKISAKVVNVVMGPTVTRYEISLGQGVSVNKLPQLASDLAVRLAVGEVRWEIPIPGKQLVGLELPNKTPSKVPIRQILSSPEFINSKGELSFAVGIDISGNKIVSNIAAMPHMLVAGFTGSGKSVALNSLIVSLLYKYSPEQLRLVLIDPKLIEFAVYSNLPHLMVNEIISESDKICATFKWLVDEMERRYKLLRSAGVVDITGYNRAIDTRRVQRLPRIVVIVDEYADIMTSAIKGEVEQAVLRLAQKARAAGIHLVLAMQRPTVQLLSGNIKNNFGWRMALKVSSQVDSKTMLDISGAERLLGKGDMLFKMDSSLLRLQGTYIDMEAEVREVVEYIKNNNDCNFSRTAENKILKSSATPSNDVLSDDGSSSDPELLTALRLCLEKKTASISLLQRYLKIGWNRAGRIMEDLEKMGCVSPQDGSKPRQLLITMEEFEETYGNGEQ